MPFDFKPLTVEKSVNLNYTASHLELYLIGTAYNSFSEPRIASDYYSLDQTTSLDKMPEICNSINQELQKFLLPQIPKQKTFSDLVGALRKSFKSNEKRFFLINWLVGNKNKHFLDLANKENVWSLPYQQFFEFCKSLSTETNQ